MKIYGSSIGGQAVGEEFYQLSVVNRWDFSTDAICYKRIDGNAISFSIAKYKKISIGRLTKEEAVISDDIKKELEAMGYELANKRS